jgi:proteic killer suppression protein
MEVEFKDESVGLVETDRAAETKLPAEVINSLRQKLVVIRAAPDERTLRNWKSLHYEKLERPAINVRSESTNSGVLSSR